MQLVEKRKSMLINFTFYALLIAAYYFFMKYAFGLVAPFVIAFAVAMLLQKPVRAISKKTHIKKSIISAISIVLILSVIAGVLIFAGYRISVEFKGLWAYIMSRLENLPQLITSIESWIISHLAFLPDSIETTAVDAITNFADRLLLLVVDQKNTFGEITADAPGFDLSVLTTPIGGLLSTAKRIPAILTAILISIIACFFVTCDYDNFTNMIKKNISEEHEKNLVKTKKILGDIIGKMCKSYATIIFVTFCEISIGLNILKLIGVYDGGYIIAISFVTALIDIVPVLGTGTVLIPWAIINLFSGNFGLGIGLIVLYAAITVIRQILEPRLVAMNVGLHPVLTLAGMYLGLQIFGVIGIFAVPITFVLVKVLNDEGIIHLWGRNRTISENTQSKTE